MNNPFESNIFPTLFIVPTGIGCPIGGYAGDAIPSARLIAAASDCLITHPNVMNAASLYWNDQRIQYVEGYGLDRFAAGEIKLMPVLKQTIGLLLDKGLNQESRRRHLQVVDACRASLGLDIGSVITTDESLEVSLQRGESGSSWGTIRNPSSLLRAGEKLKDLGATAIAIVTKFPDDDSESLNSYRKGIGVDALSGAEAVISHLLVSHLSIPCAHTPAVPILPINDHLDPRAAGEELGYTFLPCVLVGLSRAPDMIFKNQEIKNSQINWIKGATPIGINDIGAVIVPDGALGGDAILSCIQKRIPLITVCNQGVLNITANALGLNKPDERKRKQLVFQAKNYLEAAGIVLSLREGINLESLRRPLNSVIEN